MIRHLLGSIRQYKRDTIVTPLFIICEVLLEVAVPLLMAKLIDHGIDAGNMDYILKMGGILFLCLIISLSSGVFAGKSAARASAGFARNLRQDIYYHVQDFSFSNIDKFSTAGLVTRLTTDVTNVQDSFMMLIRVAVRSPFMLTFALIMSFSVNPKLALIFLCAIPVLGAGTYLIIRKAYPIFQRVFHTYDKLNLVVQENLRGIRVVKSFVREQHEYKKFRAVSQSIYQDFTKAEKIVAFNMPLMQFCLYACMLLVSWFGARMIVSRTMTTGQLMGLITYAMQILMSLMMVSMVFMMITMSRASAERIVAVLDEVPDLRNAKDPIYDIPDGSISFQNVDFSYVKDKDKLSLSGINLDIGPGETVGILGGTGSGKSTLVQLIPRLYDITGGTLSVGGIDVRDIDIRTLREKVAIVLQKNVLFSGTIKENLRWGSKDASDEEIRRACELAQADGFIESFPDKYDTRVEQGGANLSGGQKQRLSIARALLKKPEIIILDDSTSAVDTKTDTLIRRALLEELPRVTKLIITQRISSVEGADKIIVMNNGTIGAVGKHDELLNSNDIYREVYFSQVKEDGHETETPE